MTVEMMKSIYFLLFIHGYVFLSVNGEFATDNKVTVKFPNETLSSFITRIFRGYQRLNRPLDDDNITAPTTVEVDLNIKSIGQISMINMDFTVDLLLHQRWTDKRLRYEDYDGVLVYSGDEKLIWTSDLYFHNAKISKIHDVTKRNEMVWIHSNGTVLHSNKLSLTVSCVMNFENFPMDVQQCNLAMGSFGYSDRDIKIIWRKNGQKVRLGQTQLNEYAIIYTVQTECDQNFDIESFSCIQTIFVLERNSGFYMVYTYFPTFFIVCISWLSFFIDFTATPARVTLGLLSMLTLLTQSSAAIGRLPRISYIKALDIWLFACLAFVVTAILEFAFVNSLCRDKPAPPPKAEKATSKEEEQGMITNDNCIKTSPQRFACCKKKFSQATGHKVDRIFRFLFPLIFLIFNIIYWSHYQAISEKETSVEAIRTNF